MAEQRTFNPLVQGSTPWRPTHLDQVFYPWLGVTVGLFGIMGGVDQAEYDVPSGGGRSVQSR